MNKNIVLVETFNDNFSALNEEVNGVKKLYLQGIFQEAEVKNQNQRIYDLGEMREAQQLINDRQNLGRHILGHLDHPSDLDIKLENVSHKFISATMKGNQMHCKVEILEGTPKGAIAAGLINAGVNIGASTRGSGQVNEDTGRVTNFKFKTADLVAEPSCVSAHPTTLREQIELYKRSGVLTDLAEAQLYDPVAQMYFRTEILKFIDSVIKR